VEEELEEWLELNNNNNRLPIDDCVTRTVYFNVVAKRLGLETEYINVKVDEEGVDYSFKRIGHCSRRKKKVIGDKMSEEEVLINLINNYALELKNELLSTIEIFEELNIVYPNQELILNNLGSCYYQRRFYSKALDYCRKSLKVKNNSFAWELMGYVLWDKGLCSKALKCFIKAKKINPGLKIKF
jgi:tetratricopeptide (TPR) repeat protein